MLNELRALDLVGQAQLWGVGSIETNEMLRQASSDRFARAY